MATSYPFDPTGQAASNRILNENKTLPAAAYRNFHFIVPDFAPFHRNGLVVRHHPSGVELVEGVDYWLTHQFTEATRSIGRPVYGSISFLNKNLAGTISMDYRTIGGDWTISGAKIIEILSNQALNPRITTWEQVANIPYAFPPTNHNWDLEDLKGADDVVEAIESITQAVQASRDARWNQHIGDHSNPHGTSKADIGLEQVQNYPVATQGKALEGIDNESYMTPLRTRQFFNEHVGDIGGGGGGGGTGNVTGPAASVSGSVASFDGLSGKYLDDLQQIVLTVTPTNQRTSVGKERSGLETTLSLVDGAVEGATRRVNFNLSAGALASDLDVSMPATSGRMLVDADMRVSSGYVAYRSANGQGLPDAELPVRATADANSLVIRTATGSVVIAPAQALGEAVNLGQAVSLFVPLEDHGLVPFAAIVGNLAQPSNASILSTAGLQAILAEYVTRAEIGDIGGGSAEVLSVVVLEGENLPYTTPSNRIIVLGDLVEDETILMPSEPNDGDRVVICTTGLTPGIALSLGGSGKEFLGVAGDRRLDMPYTTYEFQYNTTMGSWIAVSTSNYLPDGHPSNYSPIIYRGTYSLAEGTLPDLSRYNVGDELEITNGQVIDNINYPNGAFIRRTPLGWTLTGANDTTDLENTLDALIAGFNNLATALQ